MTGEAGFPAGGGEFAPAPGGLLLHADLLLTPHEAMRPGRLLIIGDRIAAVGGDLQVGEGPATRTVRLPPDWLLCPGFVQMHVHGGGGYDMTAGDAASIQAAANWHLPFGATATVISLVTAPLDNLARSLSVISDLVKSSDDGTSALILGSHLEGPFLSPARRGVHDPRFLVHPRAADIAALSASAQGTLRMVTIAPELPGALSAISAVVEHGAAAAIGHTDATYEQTRAGIAAGATVATHLFNGMRPLTHRDPGPIVAALDAPTVVCELIADGVHVHTPVMRVATKAAGIGRFALISDAVAATGAPDGEYRLGTARVISSQGVLSLPDGSSLAGGTVTLDEVVRSAVDSVGLTAQDAIAAITSVPARALGVNDRVGSLAVGREADLCVLDGSMRLRAVMRRGRWINGEPAFDLAAEPAHRARPLYRDSARSVTQGD